MASNVEIIYKTKGVFKINNISRRDGADSDVITIGSDEWRVSLQYKDINGHSVGGIYLCLHKSTEKTIDADFMAYIVDTNYHRTRQSFLPRRAIDANGYGFLDFVDHSTLRSVLDQKDVYLHNNCLTIGFNVTVYKPLFVGHKRCQFVNSFNNKDLSDCRIVVKGKEFFASKAILSDRSEVFHNIFTTNMSDNISHDVIIKDIDAYVFKEFLRFLYFGDSNKLQELAEELLYVSEKYMVWNLKTICVNLVYLGINPKNAFKVLKLMDKYDCNELKAKAMQYIKNNSFQCLESNLFKVVDNRDGIADQLSSYLKTNSNRFQWSTQIMSYTYMPFVTAFDH